MPSTSGGVSDASGLPLAPGLDLAAVQQASEPHARVSKASFYRPELDVLRFIAFAMVFVAHTLPRSPLLRGAGNFGLPLFFALSSYLITELLLREKAGTGSIDSKAFYIRRALRIWPLYFLVLLLTCALSHAPRHTVTFSLPHLAPYLLFAGNWAAMANDWLPFGFGVAWSISIEEQFYLFWPAVMRLLNRRALALLLAFWWLASQLFTIYLCSRPVGVYRTWCDTFVQMQYFAIGAAICLVTRRYRLHLKTSQRIAFITVAVLLFIVFPRREDISTASPYLAGSLGTALLLLAFFNFQQAGQFLALRHLGRISYGLYIFHVAVVNLVLAGVQHFHLKHMLAAGKFLIALPLTVLVAHLSYRYFETPFLQLKRRFEVVRSRPV